MFGPQYGSYDGVWLADGLVSCGFSHLSYAMARATDRVRPGGVPYAAAFLRCRAPGPRGWGGQTARNDARGFAEYCRPTSRCAPRDLDSTDIPVAPARRWPGRVARVVRGGATALANRPARYWPLAGLVPRPALCPARGA